MFKQLFQAFDLLLTRNLKVEICKKTQIENPSNQWMDPLRLESIEVLESVEFYLEFVEVHSVSIKLVEVLGQCFLHHFSEK